MSDIYLLRGQTSTKISDNNLKILSAEPKAFANVYTIGLILGFTQWTGVSYMGIAFKIRFQFIFVNDQAKIRDIKHGSHSHPISFGKRDKNNFPDIYVMEKRNKIIAPVVVVVSECRTQRTDTSNRNDLFFGLKNFLRRTDKMFFSN